MIKNYEMPTEKELKVGTFVRFNKKGKVVPVTSQTMKNTIGIANRDIKKNEEILSHSFHSYFFLICIIPALLV